MSLRKRILALKNPNDDDFSEELVKIAFELKEDDSSIFFNQILSFFQTSKITNDAGNEILLTICKLLTKKEHQEIFIKEELVKKLPLDNYLLIDNVLNILDNMMAVSPEIVPQNVLESVSKRSPYKVLILIAKVIQKEIPENLSWLDMLVENESFKKQECAESYISVLVYLLNESKTFLNNYSRKAWGIISSLLYSKNERIVKYSYISLCYLIDNNICSHSNLPFHLIASHLSNMTLHKSAFSLLLRCNLSRMNSPELIKSLIQHASSNKKASFVLLRIAKTDKGAMLLISNSSWMKVGLPDRLTTINIFCNVLLHKEVRSSLSAKTKDIVSFLSSSLSIESDDDYNNYTNFMNTNADMQSSSLKLHDNNDSVIISILCTILRRIPFDENLVHQLSRYKFFSSFFGRSTRTDTSRNAIHALHIINLIVDCCYTKELLQIIDFLIYSIKKNDDNSNFALVIAAKMCNYDECFKKLKEKKLAKYLLDLDRNNKYQRHFLRAFGAID